jgi:hypothetical protein
VTEDEERELRGQLIMAQIDKIAFDTELARRQERWDVKKFVIATVISAVLALAAAVGAGVGIGSYFTKQPGPPVIIQVPAPAPAR